jgi:Sin3 histone deacetylase corepressor complex component SDS3
MSEKKAAHRDFEEKKVELKDNMISELEERKKLIEQDRFSAELNADSSEVKTISTRKLRRRPNEPVPVPEKRRKPPQSQATFLLDDIQLECDLSVLYRGELIPMLQRMYNGKS